jgi:hypothetical protein
MWCVAPDAYWRYDGAEVVAVAPATALRLNALSAALFFQLLSSDYPDNSDHSDALNDLAKMLEAEGILVRSDQTATRERNYIAHIERV